MSEFRRQDIHNAIADRNAHYARRYESNEEFSRRIERDLDHASWRSVRPLFLMLILVLVSIWAITTEAAEAPIKPSSWDMDCIWWPDPPIWSDGRAIQPQDMLGVRVERSASSAGPYAALATVKETIYCYRPAPVGTNHYRLVGVMADGRVSEPSASMSSVTVEPPAPKILLTVGGDVWVASPDWTTFGWKPSAKAGTIVPKVKCDATRHIPPDLYRVTAPISWTNGKKNYVVARCKQQ